MVACAQLLDAASNSLRMVRLVTGLSLRRLRARRIVAGQPLTRDHVMRMHSFFSRHAVDRRPGWGTPGKETPGYVAWQAWGGDAGASWAAKQAARIKRAESGGK